MYPSGKAPKSKASMRARCASTTVNIQLAAWKFGASGMGWNGVDVFRPTLDSLRLQATARNVILEPRWSLPLERLYCTNYRSKAGWQ
jgi:hypothetical protein